MVKLKMTGWHILFKTWIYLDLEKEELEGEITLEECKEVLKTFSSGKSPGEDGFTWEFYNCFLDLLSEDLINCYNAGL